MENRHVLSPDSVKKFLPFLHGSASKPMGRCAEALVTNNACVQQLHVACMCYNMWEKSDIMASTHSTVSVQEPVAQLFIYT